MGHRAIFYGSFDSAEKALECVNITSLDDPSHFQATYVDYWEESNTWKEAHAEQTIREAFQGLGEITFEKDYAKIIITDESIRAYHEKAIQIMHEYVAECEEEKRMLTTNSCKWSLLQSYANNGCMDDYELIVDGWIHFVCNNAIMQRLEKPATLYIAKTQIGDYHN